MIKVVDGEEWKFDDDSGYWFNKSHTKMSSQEPGTKVDSHAVDFAVWYSGMTRTKVERAYKRFRKETGL